MPGDPMSAPHSPAAPEVSPEASSNMAPEARETALDGVRYARLAEAGASWRLASLSPLWREEVAGLGPAPDEAALAALASRGIRLAHDAAPPPLAVMCCGLGSGWPGMGRELYDNFPAARDAMDRVAALADWDILGLMDETDMEAVSNTRRQIPYLFLLEYAQWSQFASLGIRPALFCGHSLGELIALSLSGIYGLSEAWYILETRAEHMAELEATATRDTGMMAVHAGADVIDEVLASWPDLYISNRNTPRQFILSGPRQSLTGARQSLRKRRVPAMLLNVNLAFHHPGMRILRDLSQRRLGALEMHPAAVPMLSGITAGYYPDDQPSICRYITDLDENTVAWTDCVAAMWGRDGIRHFLELGPQDTLCGLVADCEPRALCLSAGRKGHEVAAMREACARLFTLGHLSLPVIRTVAAQRRPAKAGEDAARTPEPLAAAKPAAPPESLFGADAESARKVLELLAEASGRPLAELRPEQDLRYDLALRSSRFPLLLQEAERRLGVRVEFEALLRVTTVGDLVAVLLGRGEAGGHTAEGGTAPVRNRRLGPFPPLLRFAPPHGTDTGRPAPLPLDPAGTGPGIRAGGVYALCVLDDALLPEIWGGLGSFAATLAVPQESIAACTPLMRAGSSVVPLEMDAASGPEALVRALDALLAAEGRLDGVLLVPEAAELKESAPEAADLAPACGAWCAGHGAWFAALRRWLGAPELVAAVPAGEAPAAAGCVAEDLRTLAACGAAPALALLDDGRPLGPDTLGDRFAAELFRGGGAAVLLGLGGGDRADTTPQLLDRPEVFAPVYPEPWSVYLPELAPESGLFQGGFQFSAYADPALLQHGGWGAPAENAGAKAVARLPFARAILALLQGARLLLPWLTVTGFSDVRFFAQPEIFPGITREGRVTARGRPWIMHDGAMTRMCRTRLDIRGLTANGRHTDTFAPLAEGMALLASGPREAPPLGPLPPGTDEPLPAPGPLPLQQLYARLGLGPDWQLLSRLAPVLHRQAGDVLAVHRGTLAPEGPASAIAPRADWGYAYALRLTAAVMESASLVLAHEAASFEGDAAGAPDWRCEGVGYLRFGAVAAQGADATATGGGPQALELRRTWDDGRRVRFDAEVVAPGGGVLLTVHHLEFERQGAAE